MRRWLVTLVCLLAFTGHQTLAQSCAPVAAVQRLSASAIRSIVADKYVCVGAGADVVSNELHTGGSIIDYKKGPNDPIDPSSLVGSYTVVHSDNGGIISYTYLSGGEIYSYHVQAAGGNHYDFCPVGGAGQAVTVLIRPAHC